MLEKDHNFTPPELDAGSQNVSENYNLPRVIGREDVLKVSQKPSKYLAQINSWVFQDEEDLPLDSGHNINFGNLTFPELGSAQKPKKIEKLTEVSLRNQNNQEFKH